MPREFDKHDRWRAKKKRESTKLKEDKKLCETEWCFQIIWSWEQYCDSCELSRYPERAKRCLADNFCIRKVLKTSDSNYCTQHSDFCWVYSCNNRKSKNEKYCSLHLGQEELQSLVKQRTSLFNPQEVIRFNTCWNNNLATVINGNNPYTLWLLVYEPAVKSRSEILQKFEISNGYDRYNLASAKNKASSLRNELNGENPILAIHPYANSYVSFSSLITNPYVIKIDNIPSWTTEPDRYLRPLDIIWVRCEKVSTSFWHAGIYLGSNQVCHFTKDKKNTTIDPWSYFLSGSKGSLQGYHPVIPFKDYRSIVGQVVWAKDNNFYQNYYSLSKRNCEHLANMLVYGINYSQQVYEREGELITKTSIQTASGGFLVGASATAAVLAAPFTFGTSLVVGAATTGTLAMIGTHGVITTGSAVECDVPLNNGKDKICLTNEIKDTGNLLGQKSDSETREYHERYLQEIPLKDNCRIM